MKQLKVVKRFFLSAFILSGVAVSSAQAEKLGCGQ